MIIHLSHFSAALIFALFASVVFGVTQKNTPREMLRYGTYCFVLFLAGTLIAGWAMAALRAFAIR